MNYKTGPSFLSSFGVQSIAPGPGFVNALRSPGEALHRAGKRLKDLGHTIMGGQVLSMPLFNEQSIITTLPAHRWPALEGFRYQDIPGNCIGNVGRQVREAMATRSNSPSRDSRL